MSSNHLPDDPLMEQIKQSRRTGASSQNPVLDDLASLTPRATSAFQQRLEAALLNELNQPDLRSISMQATTHYPIKAKRRPWHMSIKPVAAIFALLLLGWIVLGIMTPPPTEPAYTVGVLGDRQQQATADTMMIMATQIIQQATQTAEAIYLTEMPYLTPQVVPWITPTFTSTPIPFSGANSDGALPNANWMPSGTRTLSFVVAAQDIAQGTVIAAEMVTTGYMSFFAFVPSDFTISEAYLEDTMAHLREFYITDVAGVIGKTAHADLMQGEMIRRPALSLDEVGLNERLPAGKVAMRLPLTHPDGATAFQEGDVVDVIATMMFVDVDESFQQIVSPVDGGTAMPDDANTDVVPRLTTTRLAEAASVLHVELTSQAGEAGMTLAVSPAEARLLAWGIEAKLPLTFVLRSDS